MSAGLYQPAGGNPIGKSMKIKHPQQLISRREVAARWSYSTETIKRQEKAGKLPVLRLGGQARYRLADIEFIEKQALVKTSGSTK